MNKLYDNANNDKDNNYISKIIRAMLFFALKAPVLLIRILNANRISSKDGDQKRNWSWKKDQRKQGRRQTDNRQVLLLLLLLLRSRRENDLGI